MSQDINSIHNYDFDLICEYFSTLERQGPGSPNITKIATTFIENLTNNSKIADIGCGTGGQTIVLAENLPGQIVGIDLFQKFIDIFNRNVAKRHLNDRVIGKVGSMEQLEFEDESLDLIWSEGAIYNIGFQRGLNEWKRFLKKDGYIAVTEISWFTNERPTEINDFWYDAYPEIDTIPTKIAQLQDAGYKLIASFALPDYCWTENFYKPQKEAQESFLKKHQDNKVVIDFISCEQHEAEMYIKYKAYYGYVFYIGQKNYI